MVLIFKTYVYDWDHLFAHPTFDLPPFLVTSTGSKFWAGVLRYVVQLMAFASSTFSAVHVPWASAADVGSRFLLSPPFTFTFWAMYAPLGESTTFHVP